MTPRMFIVDQSSLARTSTKARSDIYKPDGLHLTTKGLTFYTSNITKALLECYPDMAVPKHGTSQTSQGPRQSDTSSSTVRQDRRQERGGRRDRPYQDWSGYGYAGPGGQFYRPPYPDYPPPPPPGWNSGGSWGGNRQQRQQRPRDWDTGGNVGYNGGYTRGYGRRN